MSIESGTTTKRILLAPLDWGLGHATRCIPIIRKLRAKATVVIAAEGHTETLLRTEFPDIEFLTLKGYNVQYGRSGWESKAKLLLQIPRLIRTVEDEFDWLENAIKQHRIDAVISDNRYGLYNEKIPSIFITHQLLIKTGLGATADSMLQKLHGHFIEAFDECWVPDVAGEENLSGDLSHPAAPPAHPLRYIGALSRFTYDESSSAEKHLLVILSGPEPQRSILEEILLQQLTEYAGEVVFVRGLPMEKDVPVYTKNITVYNHVAANELEQLMRDASLVIGRCGYSTVMDLMALKKKSVLIPTPGQTEQEYLAVHLNLQSFALCFLQQDLHIMKAISLAKYYEYKFPEVIKESLLEDAIEGLLEKMKS